MKIRMMPNGMFYDFDNGMTLSVQYGPLSYATVHLHKIPGPDNVGPDGVHDEVRVISNVDIAVLNTETNDMIPFHRYLGDYPAVSYFPVSLLPQAMLLVQQSKLKELGDLVHNWWDEDVEQPPSEIPYTFSKEDADDAIARN